MNLDKYELKELETKASEVILEAGYYLERVWSHPHTLQYKDSRDVVTEADIYVENLLREKLHALFPEAGFIVEEGTTELQTEYNWAIDPIDGTKSFAFGVPMFFTQIALLKGNVPVVGLVYNPTSRQLFSASLGNGAALNKKPMALKNNCSLSKAIISVDSGKIYSRQEEKANIILELAQNCYRMRMTAGFLNPYVITGAVDCVINFVLHDLSIKQKPKNVVDLAPHIILFTEFGLQTQFIKTKQGNMVFVAAHEQLIKEAADIITTV
ncbi:hypothetical protein COY90_01490 [Candidatus Roizmanbacteria bacterium CG_4_10_14_0_8_um_filter_39_9]|uniref:Inositol monophosphatase n=1 Tax=Candidatus Roizmanbacteria bacterium CG_4_10_14_0_8_um_filter_39_9 TaxID=1974829 RepID=A0A2M7QDH7_9BACT|nr:MAG: hypothetical protein COY90_01490 [Candidatus Roizmanbacteria bacterium CG_4_10_14_0_8_um_filter_39_9]